LIVPAQELLALRKSTPQRRAASRIDCHSGGDPGFSATAKPVATEVLAPLENATSLAEGGNAATPAGGNRCGGKSILNEVGRIGLDVERRLDGLGESFSNADSPPPIDKVPPTCTDHLAAGARSAWGRIHCVEHGQRVAVTIHEFHRAR